MVSDIVTIKSDGSGINEALSQVEASAAFRSLSDKNMLRLRLLAEEMTGMLKGIAEEFAADFRVESDKNDFRLCLTADTLMNSEKREKFLSVSTSGQNDAAKGFMGKLRDFFSGAFEPSDADMFFTMGMTYGGPDQMLPLWWSLNKYRNEMQKKDESAEWDALETSIVGKLSDEVKVGINGNRVELTIYKSF